jgi:hypothetical protein
MALTLLLKSPKKYHPTTVTVAAIWIRPASKLTIPTLFDEEAEFDLC